MIRYLGFWWNFVSKDDFGNYRVERDGIETIVNLINVQGIETVRQFTLKEIENQPTLLSLNNKAT